MPDNWQPGKTGRGGRHGRRVGKSTMRKRRKPSGFDSPRPTILTFKIQIMAKNINQAKVERQYKQKMLAMTGSLSHTLNIADQTMDLAEQFMTEEELSNSDAYRVLEM